jgi:hypothetical protein
MDCRVKPGNDEEWRDDKMQTDAAMDEDEEEYQYDALVAPLPEHWLELDEMERIWLVQDYHRRAGIALPDGEMHAMIHAVVENQIAAGSALPVQVTLERLMQEGLDRHDALHAIGAVLAEHLRHLSGQTPETVGPDPNRRYFSALARLTAKGWQASQ